MTTMEKIEGKIGKVTRYDGSFCVWSPLPNDLRDVLPRGVSLAEAVDTLTEWDAEESKARKAAIRKAKEDKE
jgi:hypothetical protein